jgi:hypothetical protein
MRAPTRRATIGELRGTLTERRNEAEGIAEEGIAGEDTAAADGRYFVTEEEHDGVWRPAGRLRLLLDDGAGVPLERVTWSDRKGDTTSLTFGTPIAVTAYCLIAGNDCPDRDPADWTVEGSHDGVGWTLSITRNHGAGETQLTQVKLKGTAGAEGGAVPAQQGVCDFVGHRGRPGAGPVGCRGTSVPAPPTEQDQGGGTDQEQLLAGDFSATARSLQDAARLLGRLTRSLCS